VADDLDPTAVERAALVRLLEPGIAGTWLTPRAARRVQDALAAAGPLVTPEHDAQVAARALREAAEEIPGSTTPGPAVDPYDAACEWLLERADRIERQEGGR